MTWKFCSGSTARKPSTCPSFDWAVCGRGRRKLWATLFVLVAMPIDFASAAGPRPGDIYINLGAGLLTPEFGLGEDGARDLLSTTTQGQRITVPVLGLGSIDLALPLEISASGGSATRVEAENRPMLAINGVVGYQFSRHLGAEFGAGLTLPRILLEGPLVTRVISNDPESITIKVAAPAIIPLHLQGVYTFMPESTLSPYIAVGVLIADLGNRLVFNEATDLTASGGLEFGYVADIGAKIQFSETWYGQLGARYGRISDPELKDENGNEYDVDDLEVREIRFSVGVTFGTEFASFLAR